MKCDAIGRLAELNDGLRWLHENIIDSAMLQEIIAFIGVEKEGLWQVVYTVFEWVSI